MNHVNCVVCEQRHAVLPDGMACPNIRARRVAKFQSSCQLPSCRQPFVVGETPIAPAGNGQWCHVACCVDFEIAKFNATNTTGLLEKVNRFAIDQTEADLFRERLSNPSATVLSGVPGSGKSSHAARFTLLCDPAAVSGMVYNHAAAVDLVGKGVTNAKTFHSVAIGAMRDTMRSFNAQSNDKGAFGDRVDIDYPEMIDEGDEVSVQISHVKVHAMLNGMFPPPPDRAKGPRERKSFMYSWQTALYSEAACTTYQLGLQNCLGLPGFPAIDDKAAWGAIIERYHTDDKLEKLFEMGLSVKQREECLLSCPDAASRVEKLAELTAWVAAACQSWLLYGWVEGMPGRPWYWTEKMELVELARGSHRITTAMGRFLTTDATIHLEVGDLVLVRGSPARVHMETATQVLVIFDQAEHVEEWVPKNSPARPTPRASRPGRPL